MTAGILSIVAGVPGLILDITAATIATVQVEEILATEVLFGVGLAGITSVVFGIVAIIGGYFALQKRNWAMTLIGAIIALLATWGLGVLAIIITAVSKGEFEQS